MDVVSAVVSYYSLTDISIIGNVESGKQNQLTTDNTSRQWNRKKRYIQRNCKHIDKQLVRTTVERAEQKLRNTERQTKRQTKRQTQRFTDNETDREIDTGIYIQWNRQGDRHRDRHRHRHRDRHRDRQRDRQIGLPFSALNPTLVKKGSLQGVH